MTQIQMEKVFAGAISDTLPLQIEKTAPSLSATVIMSVALASQIQFAKTLNANVNLATD